MCKGKREGEKRCPLWGKKKKEQFCAVSIAKESVGGPASRGGKKVCPVTRKNGKSNNVVVSKRTAAPGKNRGRATALSAKKGKRRSRALTPFAKKEKKAFHLRKNAGKGSADNVEKEERFPKGKKRATTQGKGEKGPVVCKKKGLQKKKEKKRTPNGTTQQRKRKRQATLLPSKKREKRGADFSREGNVVNKGKRKEKKDGTPKPGGKGKGGGQIRLLRLGRKRKTFPSPPTGGVGGFFFFFFGGGKQTCKRKGRPRATLLGEQPSSSRKEKKKNGPTSFWKGGERKRGTRRPPKKKRKKKTKESRSTFTLEGTTPLCFKAPGKESHVSFREKKKKVRNLFSQGEKKKKRKL